MNIHEKIEKIFSQERSDAPNWAIELLDELKIIRSMLVNQKPKELSPQNHTSFYNFVNDFRVSMKPDVANNIYPEVIYKNKKIGVNFKGLLYYKENGSLLPREEAFKIYRYLYEHKLQAVQYESLHIDLKSVFLTVHC